MEIRSYYPSDYSALKALYLDGSTFGGQFDEARDGEARLRAKIEAEPDAILVAFAENTLLGSVSLIDDGRVAWLFRFAVRNDRSDVAEALHERALDILRRRGHTQVVVYSPADDAALTARYEKLGFVRGNAFLAFWKAL